MKRGDVVVVAMNTEFGKPRPALVIQSNTYLDEHPTINVLPITSELRNTPAFRIRVEPDEQNGLREISEIMVDKIQSPLRTKIGKVIGRLDSGRMAEVDRSLTVWLGIV